MAIKRSKEQETVGDRVSISPLELMTQAFLSVLVMECHGMGLRARWTEPGPMQLVMRCDIMSACDVMESRRAKSPAMKTALRIVERIEQVYHIRILLEHIRSERNAVADELSHNRLSRAGEVLERGGATLHIFDQAYSWRNSTWRWGSLCHSLRGNPSARCANRSPNRQGNRHVCG